MLCDNLKAALAKAPSPGFKLNYGTAGFRTKAEKLDHAMVRCGMLAVIRSHVQKDQATGICVTASHNPEEDNGVKIVEPDGGMLAFQYEAYVTDLVNAPDALGCLSNLTEKLLGRALPALENDVFSKACVVVAQDTRTSSPHLTELVKLGVRAMGATVIDCGVATTPMLHWAVVHCNSLSDRSVTFPGAEELHNEYYRHFDNLVNDFCKLSGLRAEEKWEVYCDAACGIGGPCIQPFAKTAFKSLNVNLTVRNRAPSQTTALNHCCGAEHVQKNRKLPANFGPDFGDAADLHCFSLDGDADRVVFFVTPSKEKKDEAVTIIDGDRIAAVFATVIRNLLMRVAEDCSNQTCEPLSVAVVQTAYANGGSTDYLQSIGSDMPKAVKYEVCIAKTGVKNLHHAAVERDIGVYFESNGHGTVYVDFTKVDNWAQRAGVEDTASYKLFRTYLAAFNHCVGDAMVDAIMLELSMRFLGIDIQGALALYPELAVVQCKAPMSRAKLDLLKAHPVHEKWLVSPQDLQDQINALVATIPADRKPRAFVRASGTEDACRVYAEAADQQSAAKIAEGCAQLLANF